MGWGRIRIGGPWGVFWEPGPSEKKNRQIPDGVFLFECRCLGFVWFLLGGVLGRYWGHIGGPWGVFWEPPPLNKQKPDKSQTGCFCLSVVVWDLSGSFWGGHWEVLGTHWGSVGGRLGAWAPPQKPTQIAEGVSLFECRREFCEPQSLYKWGLMFSKNAGCVSGELGE